ncbi:MAG: hypothetical protein GY835_04570 [bacterium]|nr:hypothetical protein [bacterium]
MAFEFGPRRGIYVDISHEAGGNEAPLTAAELAHLEKLDLIYRTICSLLYNYVPMSGHPGGSISAGRTMSTAVFQSMDYELAAPERRDADLLSMAAGHKALGLYTLWALRDEIARIAAPELLPADKRQRLRLEDLLGFRRNPVTATPLFNEFEAKALDGHPTPTTPFIRLATGASGVGLAASIGMAFAARDHYGANAPRVHIVEGEGGLTPGRVGEVLAAAGTAGLDNAILHIDWNQASIDSDCVCRDGNEPGDYVQWDPRELVWLNDWNLIYVPDGHDLQQIAAAQRRALAMDNGQPTAIVHRTTKGWQYGLEGRASHGAGHKLCSEEFFKSLAPLGEAGNIEWPICTDAADDTALEAGFWASLQQIRMLLERETELTDGLATMLRASRDRVNTAVRSPRENAPDLDSVFEAATVAACSAAVPEDLLLAAGGKTTLRGELGKTMAHYNDLSSGALLVAAADLLGSTSVNGAGKNFPAGFFHARNNPEARILAAGGICEDGMSGIMSGVSAWDGHVGVSSSYGAFIAALGHIPARLHAIGSHAKSEACDQAPTPMVLVNAHAGLKTGEDGPTHADPQPLQLLQENFPAGSAITLTPWDPREVWPLFTAALAARPAVIAPFVTRPTEAILDRETMGLAPVNETVQGVYLLRPAKGQGDGTLVLQGSCVTYAFLEDALPRLESEGIDLNVYYVASAELFDTLSEEEREAIFPEARAAEAMGITGFTMPTMYRWITSRRGRSHSLSPFANGHYLGSGQADKVMCEAGLDGNAQVEAIKRFLG